ncbi:MAG: EamA family transporter [Cyclobacteriaceae bacterium]|nr:EamA family transporter [Cyclobacteriaceae bacterium]MDH4296832.1 EamA family transporter [Cyclobacteriaceae bacterium]MDH5251393.1 EamA family transporter [Cyclobacteriaceae bacterium]
MKKDLLIAYLALGAICLIWGTTYLALRIGVLHFPPFLLVAIRQVVAGALLGGFVLTVGDATLPSWRNIMRQAIAGFFMITLGNGLVARAEILIPSGVAAIICSLMPMMVILINLAVNKQEKPTIPISIGVIVGLAGIFIMFGEHITEFSKLEHQIGIFLIFVAVLSWALGSVWLKLKNAEGNLFLNASLQMLFGGLWLIPCSLLFDDFSTLHWSMEAAFSLAYLIVFGSIIAYACYSYALRKLPMTILSLYAYVNPVVAVTLGWLVLDEKLNLKIFLAIAITVAGIYIVNRGYYLSKFWKAQFTR